ncbi:MAG: hypothetical protein CMI36_15820, partial [Owenweeksia sp.]|nr:hypothetical protein [Owenweeksia sp.]
KDTEILDSGPFIAPCVCHGAGTRLFCFCGEPLLHGEAVALGMMGELLLSAEFAGMDKEVAEEAAHRIGDHFHDVEVTGDPERILEVVKQDKKNRKGEIFFTLLSDPGMVKQDIVVPESAIFNVIMRLQAW